MIRRFFTLPDLRLKPKPGENEHKMYRVSVAYVSAVNTISPARNRSLTLMLILGSLCLGNPSLAQDGSRWFQIEVSIFSNEAPADRLGERWQADRTLLAYPKNLRRLDQLSDLLLLEEMKFPSTDTPLGDVVVPAAEPSLQQITRELILAMGPRPLRPAHADKPFRFYDLARDAYLNLPASTSDFQQTNQVLRRSGDHRLLFHGLWRQAVVAETDASPIYINGGLQYGQQHELQGSITIRFNDNADRVVVDANLWLAEFGLVPTADNNWTLPPVPTGAGIQIDSPPADEPSLDYTVTRVFQFTQSRDMRSREFHYLDHPAMGLVILVKPYEVPPVPLADIDFQ